MKRYQKIKEIEIDGFRPFEDVFIDDFIDLLVSDVRCKKCPFLKDENSEISECSECDMCFDKLKEWFMGDIKGEC